MDTHTNTCILCTMHISIHSKYVQCTRKQHTYIYIYIYYKIYTHYTHTHTYYCAMYIMDTIYNIDNYMEKCGKMENHI